MSKELEALNRIYDKYVTDDESLEDDKLFSIVETALKENVELKKMIRNFNEAIGEPQIITPTIEKKLKALEIIKEKEVNISFFMMYIKEDYCYEWYEKDHKAMFPATKKLLTQEEFDLLKEVLL